jgi:phosphate transport system substrate-binding protein
MPWNSRAVPLAALTACLAVGAAACGGAGGSGNASSSTSPSRGGRGSPGGSGSSGSLSETGSTLLYPLFNLWGPAYHRIRPGITLTAAGTGSGTGIADAEAGTVDIGASDAYLSPADVSAHPGLLNIALAISAQEIDYNVPGLAGTHLKLSGSVLAKMYTGRVTHWNDPAVEALNPGVNLPGTKVVPLHRSDSSGDTFLFTTYLTKQDPADWGEIGYGTTVAFPNVPGNLGEDGNGGMVTGCSHTPGCVAYVGISYQSQALAGHLSYAALRNGAGQSVLPTAASINAGAAAFTAKTPSNETISMIDGTAGNAYPIINYEYAIINTKSLTGPAAANTRAFLTWAISPSGGNATSFLRPVNFQPLPAPVRSRSAAQIAKIG